MDPRIFGAFSDQYVRAFHTERETPRRVYRKRLSRRSDGPL